VLSIAVNSLVHIFLLVALVVLCLAIKAESACFFPGSYYY